MPKKIAIVGSRRRHTIRDFDLLWDALMAIYEEGDTLISGGCPKGADSMAEFIAKGDSIPIKIIPAEWEKHGKRAGPIRNRIIAERCTHMIALPAPDRTGGTESSISAALQLGREVVLV